MKKFLFFLTICYLLPITNSFSQNWQWVRKYGGGAENGSLRCKDSQENLYLTGSYDYDAYFGNDTLEQYGDRMGFITKINSNGDFIWAKSFGGFYALGLGYGQSGGDVKYDSISNSIILLGSFVGTNPHIGSCTFSDASQTFPFIANLDLDGNCIWAKASYGSAMTMDNNGNFYIVGNNKYTVYCTGTQPGSFIAKFNVSDGMCQWSKSISSDKNIDFYSIKYLNNYLYISGITPNDTLYLDTAIANCFDNDIFFSKFDTTGTIQWVKTIGGPNTERGGLCDVDNFGNCYLTGYFKDTAYFADTMLTNGNQYDWFLAKYNSTGNLKWVRQANMDTVPFFYPFSYLTTDANGNTYVSGIFSGTASFGSNIVTASSAEDMFITRYDSNGNCLGVRVVGNIGFPIPGNLISTDNNCYIGGRFGSTTNFGSISLTSFGSYNGYLAKLDAITGIQQQNRTTNNSNQLLIYANPNTGKCNITIPDEFLKEENLTLRIFDNNGKLIQQQNVVFEEEKIKVNLEAEAKGVYNVTLGNKKKSYFGKIVFE